MKPIFLFTFLLAAATALSQDVQKAPYIQVTGTAEKKVVPNEIYISINIRERESGRDKISAEEQEAQLRAAVTSLDIPNENLSLSGAASNYIPIKWSRNDVVSQTEYILKVSNARDVGYVFEMLDSLKIHNAHIDRLDHSEITQFRKEVRIMAIKAAKDKADYLLEAIDETRGKAILVIENGVSKLAGNANVVSGQNDELNPIYYNLSKDRIGLFTEITLSASMYVEFVIE